MFDIAVSELLHYPVRTVGRDATVLEAATKLYDHDVGSLVVIDDGAHPIGIVTKSDINMIVAEGDVRARSRSERSGARRRSASARPIRSTTPPS